jgi:hypothetical protein
MPRFFILCMALGVLAGCAETDAPTPHADFFTGSERQIASTWNGKHVKDLVTRYGKPDMVINTTIGGRIASESYVYDKSRLAGNPSCINVYVVTLSDSRVMDYFCR